MKVGGRRSWNSKDLVNVSKVAVGPFTVVEVNMKVFLIITVRDEQRKTPLDE